MRANQSTGVAMVSAMLLLGACRAEPIDNETTQNVTDEGPAITAPENIAGSAPAPPMIESTARYSLTGTEPFWGGTVDGSMILYQTPDDQAGKTIAVTLTKEGATSRYSGELGGKPFILKLTPGTCSDGMSDTIYPLHAVLAVRGEPRQGCAKPIVGTSP